MQRLLDDAFGAAEKANDKFTAEKHTNQDLQKQLSNYKEMLKSKEEEMSGLKGSLQKFKEKVSLIVRAIMIEIMLTLVGLACRNRNSLNELLTSNPELRVSNQTCPHLTQRMTSLESKSNKPERRQGLNIPFLLNPNHYSVR